MSHLPIDPTPDPSLAVLVETVTAPLLMAHPAPVCLEVDIDPSIPVPTGVAAMTEIVRAITAQMLSELGGGGDFVITACQTETTIELEMADDGPDKQHRSRSLPLAVAEAGATLNWMNCPQGGAAVTIVFPRPADTQNAVKTRDHRQSDDALRRAA